MKITAFALFLLAIVLVSCSEDTNTPKDSDGIITLNASVVNMKVDTKMMFHATVEDLTSTEVTWTIYPAGGTGTVEPRDDNYAIYTAPSTPMTVVLKAASALDETVNDEVQINVLDEMPITEEIFYNGNIYGVQSGPQNPTEFTVDKPWHIVYMENYHYFNKGILPGEIGLVHEDGTVYGPWKCVGLVGQGGVENAYWVCYPYETLKAGKYTVTDSDPDTWSHNSQSNYCGMTRIRALVE